MLLLGMKKTVQNMTDEDVSLMGDYDLDKLMYLKMFKAHQDEDQNTTSNEMWDFVTLYEQYIFHFAKHLGGEQYRGGYWTMEDGFFNLQGSEDNVFEVSSSWGHKAKFNNLEFSIAVNLFALSHLCFWAQDKKKTLINNLAVFFSDYTKDFLKKNSELLNSDIYIIID